MRNYQKLIDKIQPEDLVQVASYLKWKEGPSLKNGRVRQFIHPQEDDAIYIPMDKVFVDYNRSMRCALETLSEYEHTTLAGLITKVLNPSYDILKLRFFDEEANKGHIPFLTMQNIIGNLKDILASSYLDVVHPNTLKHSKVYTSEVNSLVESCSFGHTEVGSYLINVLCPLGRYQYTLFDPEEEDLPMLRRVNLRIMESIREIQTDILSDNINKLDEEVSANNYSLNFLDSLVDMYESVKDDKMSFIADWNERVPLPEGVSMAPLELVPGCMDKVATVAEKYRTSPEEEKKKYCGKISKIASNPELSERESVSIEISVVGDNERLQKVKATLDYKTYIDLVQTAFETGANVMISGTYRQKGKAFGADAVLEKLD